MRQVELEEEDYEVLLYILGYAAGTAMRENNRRTANLCTHLANAVNKNNPAWTPYEEENRGGD